MDDGRSRWTRVFHNLFHPALGECLNSCGSRPAIGSAATKAGMQVAATKARVADGTRPAAENKTAPDCPAEQSALQYCVAR